MSNLFVVDNCELGVSIAYSARKHLLALSMAFEMCSPNVNFESNVTPKYFTDLDIGIVCPPFLNGMLGFLLFLLSNGKMIACILLELIFIFHFSKYFCNLLNDSFSHLMIVLDCFAEV